MIECKFADLSTGVRVAYVEQGALDGTPIVLLHGISDSHRSYDLMMPHLPGAWRAFAVTLRGHGLSGKPNAGYDMPSLACDVAAFMDAVGVERAVIVGHSMSSAVALQVAADYPERVAGVVLMGAFANFAESPAIAELHEAVFEFGADCGGEFALAFQESTLANMIPQRFLDTAVRETLCMPGYAWRGAVQGMIDFDPCATARRVHAPVAIIWGDKDAYCPRSDQYDLRTALRSSRLLTLQGVGHALHWERPAKAAAIVSAFVAELEEPALLEAIA